LDDLDYADDVALLSFLQHQTQENVIKLNELAQQVGLQINTAKTNIFDFTESNVEIILTDTVLEKVDHFIYLDSKFFLIGDSTADINYRIALASSKLNKLKNIWSSKILCTRTKLRLFIACVLLVLIYGCVC
jgi:hypothetical protein